MNKTDDTKKKLDVNESSKNVKNKNKIAIIVALTICAFLVTMVLVAVYFGGTKTSNQDKKSRASEQIYTDEHTLNDSGDGVFNSEQEKRDDRKNVNLIDADDLARKLENKNFTGILYIGRHTCSACKTFRPKLNSAILSSGSEVNYLNSEIAKNDFPDEFREISDKLSIKYVPTMLAIKNGEIVSAFESEDNTVPEVTRWLKSQSINLKD